MSASVLVATLWRSLAWTLEEGWARTSHYLHAGVMFLVILTKTEQEMTNALKEKCLLHTTVME